MFCLSAPSGAVSDRGQWEECGSQETKVTENGATLKGSLFL